MKILLFSYKFYPSIGGIESISEVLANYFLENGHEVHIVTTSENNDGKVFPYNVIRNPSVFQLVKEFLWANIIFENNPCLTLSWPNVIFRRPIIVGLQTWINMENKPVNFQNKLKIYWLNNANRVVACSNAVRAAVFPKADLIGNPYDDHKFKAKKQIQKNKDFVFLGRLVSDKGVALAIDAFNEFLKRVDKAIAQKSTFTIIGDGNQRAALEKQVKEYGLDDKVLFMNSMSGEELTNTLNQHRYMVVPSLWNEPFGIVALEGMACGCVPIVSDGGGLPDAVGNAGLVCKQGDLESLVSCMIALKEDITLEKQLREKATIHLTAHQAKQVGQSYLNIIQSV